MEFGDEAETDTINAKTKTEAINVVFLKFMLICV